MNWKLELRAFWEKTVIDLENPSALSPTEKLSLAVAFLGVDIDLPERSTLSLAFGDFEQGYRPNYQATFVPEYAEICPITLVRGRGEKVRIMPKYIMGKGAERIYHEHPEWFEVRVHSSILSPLSFYCNQVGPEGEDLPTSLIINPNRTCSEGCKGCARSGFFEKNPEDYIKRHVREVADYYQKRFPGKEGWLGSVSITTGCRPSPETELAMMMEIARAYREQGFDPLFQVFSNKIGIAGMEELSKVAYGYVASVEAVDDQVRRKVWGGQKGKISWNQHMSRLKVAKSHFPIVEASLVFGHDGFAEVMTGLDEMAKAEIRSVGNVLRPYCVEGLSQVHPDVWMMGNSYFVELFEKVREEESLWSISKLIRGLAMSYLQEINEAKLPLKKM